MTLKMKSKILLFLKGFLMGICDLIPGISGGTIAFITGIYIRLINAVKGISPKLFYDFFSSMAGRKGSKKRLKKDIEKLDFVFLLVLLLGITTALLVGSRAIKFLLDNYFSYTIAFFVGLILASSKIIFNEIKNHKIKNIIFGVFGLIIGIIIAMLVPLTIESPSLYYVFLGGFLAVSAMFLPGISGAFILLIMGIYGFMINVLHNILDNVSPLLIFILGAILGALVISRVISFLFEKDKCKTLYVLLGLVIGSLSVPIKRIFAASLELNIFIILSFVILGALLVIIINSLRPSGQNKQGFL